MIIRTVLAILICAVGAATSSGQVVWHVDDDAAPDGDGLTWESSFRFLQQALVAAGPGDEIRVAQGVYRPDETPTEPDGSGIRTVAFVVGDDLHVLGGYRGLSGDGRPDDRDIDLFETILSGDLEENDGPDFANTDDNSNHVVETTGSGTESLLEGFTIRDGCACTGNNAQRRGAGIYHPGGAHTIRQCRIIDNKTNEFGGGVYALGPITMQECVVADNLCQGKGGGLYMKRFGPDSAHLSSTVVSGNVADEGGGVWVESGAPMFDGCTFELNDRTGVHVSLEGLSATSCQFIGNTSSGNLTSAGLYSLQGPVTLIDCHFESNSAAGNARGAAWLRGAPNVVMNCQFIANQGDGGPGGLECSPDTSVVDCHFEGNSTTSYGGALAFWAFEEDREGIVSLVDSCTFIDNATSSQGSGVTLDNNSQVEILLSITDCTFTGGTATSSSSATIYVEGNGVIEMADCLVQGNTANVGGLRASTSGSIVRCDFIDNFGSARGGAMYLTSSTIGLDVQQCRFLGNESNNDGGGVYSIDRFVRFANCLFSGNVSGSDGGALAFQTAGLQTSVTSCSIVNNAAADVAGLFLDGGVIGDVSNSIFWGNVGEDGVLLGTQHNVDMNTGFMRHCCVDQLGEPDVHGNFGDDPAFVLATGLDGIAGTIDDDLRPGTISSCIDRGLDSALPDDDLDLDNDGDTSEPLPIDSAWRGARRRRPADVVGAALDGRRRRARVSAADAGDLRVSGRCAVDGPADAGDRVSGHHRSGR